jgi:L-threonylcarbamoyladenylate synthase
LNTPVPRIANPGQAAAALWAGELVGLPTETVYGLGALADDPSAIARLYAAKGRPADHPVIVHIADAAGLDAWATEIPEYARALAATYWPGPLTLVLPRGSRVRDDCTGGQDSVALRAPAHSDFQAVLAHLGSLAHDSSVGIAAPSANRFGRVSPTTPDHVLHEFPDIDVLDGGPCEVGVESTIVDCTGAEPRVLRAGAITLEDIEECTGLPVHIGSRVRAPGTLPHHYAPAATVILTSAAQLRAIARDQDGSSTGVIALDDIDTPEGFTRIASPADSNAYAHQLYAALRDADDLGLRTVLAVPPARTGVGTAVCERLERAAAASSDA